MIKLGTSCGVGVEGQRVPHRPTLLSGSMPCRNSSQAARRHSPPAPPEGPPPEVGMGMGGVSQVKEGGGRGCQ